MRTFYLTILATHSLLAAIVPFLAVITLWRALRERFEKHVKIARWTLPIWLYVSVTGVVVYWMLYHLYLWTLEIERGLIRLGFRLCWFGLGSEPAVALLSPQSLARCLVGAEIGEQVTAKSLEELQGLAELAASS